MGAYGRRMTVDSALLMTGQPIDVESMWKAHRDMIEGKERPV